MIVTNKINNFYLPFSPLKQHMNIMEVVTPGDDDSKLKFLRWEYLCHLCTYQNLMNDICIPIKIFFFSSQLLKSVLLIITDHIELTLHSTTPHRFRYSHLFNKHGGWNKRGGGAKVAKSINVEVGILQLESSPFVFKNSWDIG